MLAALLGDQRPRLESRPHTIVASYGELAVDFAAAAGMKLDDWEEYVLWGLHDVDEQDRWAASEAGLLVSRQNGKSEILIAYDLARLFLFPVPDLRRRTILHTAHEVKTATESFEKLSAIIGQSEQLSSMVKHVYTANGKEGIVLHPRRGQLLGDRVRFIARSKNSGRGFAGNDIIYDEAQELANSARSALTYTQTTIANRQEVFAGTAPSDENESEVWEGVRDRGRAGTSPRTMWMEWSPTGAENPDLVAAIDVHDPETWKQGIPALGIRIEPETVQEQVDRTTDRDELLRERFSVWPARRPEQAVQLSDLSIPTWIDSAHSDWTIGDSPTIAIALPRSGGFATVAVASRADEDLIFVEHKHTERGTLWVANYVAKLRKELGAVLVVIDPKNASSIITDLERAKVPFMSMNMNEVAAAHSQFVEYVNAGLIAHRGQEELTKSLQFATTRKLRTAGVTWEQSDPAKPITHAQAATWAVWAVKKHEANPKKPRTGEAVFR